MLKPKFSHINKLMLAAFVATSGANAEVTLPNKDVIIEAFDGEDTSLILGGQIDLQQESKPWVFYVADEELILENRREPKSLHYNDIKWVKYPGNSIVETTDGAVISAVVEADATSNGAVGILVGSGKQSSYTMFSVDNKGRYHLLQKNGRELRRVHLAADDAVLIGQPNELSFQYHDTTIGFLVNGKEVIQIESVSGKSKSRQIQQRSGIGIAAFGIGKYSIDDVKISRGPIGK